MKNFHKKFNSKEEANNCYLRLTNLRDRAFFRKLSEVLDTFTEVFNFADLTSEDESKFSLRFGDYRSHSKYYFIYPTEKTKKKHKTKYHLVPFSFIAKMADNMELGLKHGRKEGDWVRLEASPENIDLYTDKLMRHLVSGDYAAVACNAMILDRLANKPIFNEEE